MTEQTPRDLAAEVRTKAQERYDEAASHHYSNKEEQLAHAAFERAEEVSEDLGDWTALVHARLNTMGSRIAALESSRRDPDLVCAIETLASAAWNQTGKVALMVDAAFASGLTGATERGEFLDILRAESRLALDRRFVAPAAEPALELAIKALEQAHAELAAKVDAIEMRVGGIFHDTNSTMNQHNSIVERLVEMEVQVDEVRGRTIGHDARLLAHCQEIRRIESVMEKWKVEANANLDIEDQVLASIYDHLAALESPAPAPDPVCQCGHEAKWHNDNKRKCNHVESLRPYVRCECEEFTVPTAQPAPLDPVMVPSHEWEMVIHWVNESKSSDRIDYCLRCGIIRKSYFHASGEAVSPTYLGVDIPRGNVDTPACLIRAYGKDGAR